MNGDEMPYKQRTRNMKEFYGFLLSQASDLKSAKIFYHKYQHEMNQELPIWGCFSLRSMCSHLSNALEGRITACRWLEFYGETKYGSEIYLS